MTPGYSENALVEQPAIALFSELEWETANCFFESASHCALSRRDSIADVVSVPRLAAALRRLNPGLPAEAMDAAVEALTQDRRAMTPAQAHKEVHTLLKNGVVATFADAEGEQQAARVRVIDWERPEANDYFLASQLWITGDMYTRRPDLVGFVNGLPLVFVEFKGADKPLKDAYDDNLRDYKDTIPHLFWYTGLLILSNGVESRVGTITAGWEHFSEWKRISSEGERGVVSLETMIRGVCEPTRLLDLVENFILHHEAQGGLRVLLAKNHQYLGVNNAIRAVQNIRENQGRLGVFWHTQGSGKSFSMVFFAQKILRKLAGNWTFLVVTDRDDLDNQIYKNFANTGAVLEDEQRVRAQSGAHLRQLLQEDHRYLFTLIQKFRTEQGAPYPRLSDRGDIIVITDEAHRSQYDVFAANMRTALPGAAFIGFTGTPLMAGEERTRAVFGDYVSIYNFKQSVDDQATVPLYYENRIPELQLTNEQLNTDMERLLEEAELDESQEQKLEREFAREYHLITRDDRLETIAADLVRHFVYRGYLGKGMFIAVDRFTAVRMYDKVQKHWQLERERLRQAVRETPLLDAEHRDALSERIAYMDETDMAVVISSSQNEVDDFRQKGLEIAPHRRRMMTEDLETHFKDAAHPLRLVFVCAMWITGFDAPACSTIYVDKPMRNHTLMQTIARANRVFGDKVNGLIVDYIGVFRDLQRALAIYGTAAGGGVQPGETPVQPKTELVAALRAAIAGARAFCVQAGAGLDAIHAVLGFERLNRIEDAVDALLVNDETKAQFLMLAAHVDRLFHAVLPDPAAAEFGTDRKLMVVLAGRLRSLGPDPDISLVMGRVEILLDRSIETYHIPAPVHDTLLGPDVPLASDHLIDLSKIDFEALRKRFEQGRKRIEAEKLRGLLNARLQSMVRLNRTRLDYLEKFQRLIDDYNAGSANVDLFFEQLVAFAQSLSQEEQRGLAERLTEEELAVFDQIARPGLNLSPAETENVKQVAKELLEVLKREKLVLDWRRRQQTRAGVRLTIEQILDRLPPRFDRGQYQVTCDFVYQHVYDAYYGSGRSLYARAA